MFHLRIAKLSVLMAIVLSLIAGRWSMPTSAASPKLEPNPPLTSSLSVAERSERQGDLRVVFAVTSTVNAEVTTVIAFSSGVRLIDGTLMPTATVKAGETVHQMLVFEVAPNGSHYIQASSDAVLIDGARFHTEAHLLLQSDQTQVGVVAPAGDDLINDTTSTEWPYDDAPMLQAGQEVPLLGDARTATATLAESGPEPTQGVEVMPLKALPQPGATLEIDFDSVVDLPQDLKEPVRGAMEQDRYLLPLDHQYTVTAVRIAGDWAEVFAVPSRVVHAGWEVELRPEDVVEILAHQINPGEWSAYIRGGKGFEELKQMVPHEFSDYLTQPDEQPAQIEAVTYLFPWTKGQQWYKTQGWHSGNAIDFQPVVRNNPPVDLAVLAAAPGRLTETCNDSKQSTLQIEHADGATRYVHLAANSIRRDLLGQQVVRGQYLGLLYNPGGSYTTSCGTGTAVHLHFVLPTRNMTIDGYTAEAVASSAYATRYTSSNARTNGEDLVVLDIWSTTAPLRTGELETIQLRVQNQGTAPINRRFYVQLWIGSTSIGSWYVDSLGISQTVVGTTQVRVGTRGYYALRATVDTSNTIVETSETNNTRLETWYWN